MTDDTETRLRNLDAEYHSLLRAYRAAQDDLSRIVEMSGGDWIRCPRCNGVVGRDEWREVMCDFCADTAATESDLERTEEDLKRWLAR